MGTTQALKDGVTKEKSATEPAGKYKQCGITVIATQQLTQHISKM